MALKKWKKGDPVKAAHLNEVVEAIEEEDSKRQKVTPPVRVNPFSLAPPISRRFRIKSVQGDYLTCRTWNGVVEGGNDVLVAKNYLLRNSIVSRGGISYTYTSTTERTANDGADTENQVVVPSYVVNDEIFAIPFQKGGTGAENPSGGYVNYLDINSDGRAWAKKAE